MAVNTTFLAMSVVGALVVLFVLFLMTRVRPWHYPVRDTTIDLGVRERTTELLSRGPSAETETEFEAEEPRQPDSFWERVKLGLYTYPKRPSKR